MIENDESRSTIPLRLVAILIAALGIFPMAAVIRWAPVVSWLPRAAAEWAVSLFIVTVVCFLLAKYAGTRVDDALAGVRRGILAAPPRDFAIYIGLVTLFASVFVAWLSFGGQPASGDEMAQRFQARLLVAGRLWGVAEEPFQFFSGIQTVNVEGRWFAQLPIGGPLLLAIGMLFKAAWLVNPVLAGWTAANVYRFAAKTTDESTGRLAAILFAASPFVLLMSGSQMNHAGALAFLMYGLVGLADWIRATGSRALASSALRIGFGFGASAAVRPYEAAVIAVVVGLFQLAHARRAPDHLKSIAWQLAGAALPVAILLLANAGQTGHPLLFGYDALNGTAHRPGFHVDPNGKDFGPARGIHHISSYLLLLNASLFGGPIPSVLLIVGALALVPRATKGLQLLAAIIIAVLAAYACYWAASYFVGPRFLYAAVPMFVIAVATLPRSLASRASTPVAARAARLLLPLSLICAWILPSGVARFQGVWSQLMGERRANVATMLDLDAAAREEGIVDALVIVHEPWHGRLTARLRALGAPALRAEAMLREFDACGLHVGLDAEERIGGPPGLERVQRVARRALMYGDAAILEGTSGPTTLAFARPLHPYCVPELQADAAGSARFDQFLANARFDRTGRLAGNVVYARDFSSANHRLLTRFGHRTWYRYRPRTGPHDDGPMFVPYSGR